MRMITDCQSLSSRSPNQRKTLRLWTHWASWTLDRLAMSGDNMKKKERPHFVRADMMADYLDEHDGEVPHDRDYREPDALNYGCADIDDIDSLIDKWYSEV